MAVVLACLVGLAVGIPLLALAEAPAAAGGLGNLILARQQARAAKRRATLLPAKRRGVPPGTVPLFRE